MFGIGKKNTGGDDVVVENDSEEPVDAVDSGVADSGSDPVSYDDIPDDAPSPDGDNEAYEGDDVVDETLDDGADVVDEPEEPERKPKHGLFARFGRSKNGDDDGGDELKKKNKHRKDREKRPNELLSSVLRASEPGAALALASDNGEGPFYIDSGAQPGSIVLVVDVATEEFGGLSQRQDGDEDKGQIISHLQNDQIKPIVTEDMLDNDELGIIPDIESLETMSEFELLRTARFNWAIATEFPEDGELAIAPLPDASVAAMESKARNREYMFTTAQSIAERNETSVDQFVNIDVAHLLLWAIHEGIDPVGLNELSVDIIETIHVLWDETGQYPSIDDIIASLSLDEFSPDEQDAFIRTAQDGDGKALFGEPREDDIVDSSDSESQRDAVSDSGLIEAEVFDSNVDVSGGAGDVWDTEPDEFDEPDRPASPASTAPAVLSDEAIDRMVQRFSGVLAARDEQADTRAVVREELQNMFYDEEDDEEEPEDSRTFDSDDVRDRVNRVYNEGDLVLSVDGDQFVREVTWNPSLLTEPDKTMTEWLGSQVSALVDAANQNLVELNERNTWDLANLYRAKMDETIRRIQSSLAIDNENSEYAEIFKSVAQTENKLFGSVDTLTEARKEELRRNYDAEAEASAKRAYEAAKADFYSRHRMEHETALNRVKSMIINDVSQHVSMIKREPLVQRQKLAEMFLSKASSDVVKELVSVAEKRREQEAAAAETARKELEQYISDHREDDIKLSRNMQTSSEHEQRYEQLQKETEQRVKSMADQMKETVAAKAAELETARRDFDERIKQIHASYAERLNAEKNNAVAEAEALRQQLDTKSQEIKEIQQNADTLIEQADRRAEASKKDAESYIDTHRKENVVLIVVLVVACLVCGLLGYMIGA